MFRFALDVAYLIMYLFPELRSQLKRTSVPRSSMEDTVSWVEVKVKSSQRVLRHVAVVRPDGKVHEAWPMGKLEEEDFGVRIVKESLF